MTKEKFKIVILIPYFGDKLPIYFDLFLKSVKANNDISFYFFSNLNIADKLPDNCKLFKKTLKDIELLASQKTNTPVKLLDPYKLCDLKTLYGLIFQDYITDYDFWGYSDIDLIFGDLTKYIFNTNILIDYDVISFREEWLSGSFALFRNSTGVNMLFQQSKDWKDVLSNPTYLGFDEVSKPTIPLKKGEYIFSELEKSKSLSQINTEIESMTHVLKFKQHNLKIRFEDQINELISKGMILKYDSKSIRVHKKGNSSFENNQEFMYYHYITEKITIYFSYLKWRLIPDEFFISQYGFHKTLQFLQLNILIRKLNTIIFKQPLRISVRIFRKIIRIAKNKF